MASSAVALGGRCVPCRSIGSSAAAADLRARHHGEPLRVNLNALVESFSLAGFFRTLVLIPFGYLCELLFAGFRIAAPPVEATDRSFAPAAEL